MKIGKWALFLIYTMSIVACSTSNAVKYGDSRTEAPSISNKKEDQFRQDLVHFAKEQIGSKYKYGGNTPKGFDCSGFTSFVLDKFDIQISRSSQSQSIEGNKVKLQNAQAGDLVFFTGTGKGKITHVALTVKNNESGLYVIHSTSSKGVIMQNISESTYWKPKILFARDIISLQP